MNIYQERQTSGNVWPLSTLAANYPPQTEPELSVPNRQTGILDNLEGQMIVSAHGVTIRELRRVFVLHDEESVLEFLNEHRSLPQILIEASSHLKDYFGQECVFALKAPLDGSGSRTLYAIVMWTGKVQDAVDALAEFDDEWWIPRAARAAGYLTFTYELT